MNGGGSIRPVPAECRAEEYAEERHQNPASSAVFEQYGDYGVFTLLHRLPDTHITANLVQFLSASVRATHLTAKHRQHEIVHQRLLIGLGVEMFDALVSKFRSEGE